MHVADARFAAGMRLQALLQAEDAQQVAGGGRLDNAREQVRGLQRVALVALPDLDDGRGRGVMPLRVFARDGLARPPGDDAAQRPLIAQGGDAARAARRAAGQHGLAGRLAQQPLGHARIGQA